MAGSWRTRRTDAPCARRAEGEQERRRAGDGDQEATPRRVPRVRWHSGSSYRTLPGQIRRVPGGAPSRPVGRVAGMAHEDREVSLYEGLLTTRAIRRYTDEPVPDEVLRDILFAATRAPSGSNRQPFRFVVLTDGPVAAEAKRLIGDGARGVLGRQAGGRRLRHGVGRRRRLAQGAHGADHAALRRHLRVGAGARAGLLRPLPPTPPQPRDGASVYPACQNLLLAARALGYGGVMTGLALRRRRRAARPAAASPTRWRSWRPSRSGARRATTVRCADARCPSWCTGSGGARPPPGRSTPTGAAHTAAGRRRRSQYSLRCCATPRPRGRLTMHAVDSPVFDADNHYYEALDAFTRHLDPALGPRVIQWVEVDGRRYHALGRPDQPRRHQPDLQPDLAGRRAGRLLPGQPRRACPCTS